MTFSGRFSLSENQVYEFSPEETRNASTLPFNENVWNFKKLLGEIKGFNFRRKVLLGGAQNRAVQHLSVKASHFQLGKRKVASQSLPKSQSSCGPS